MCMVKTKYIIYFQTCDHLKEVLPPSYKQKLCLIWLTFPVTLFTINLHVVCILAGAPLTFLREHRLSPAQPSLPGMVRVSGSRSTAGLFPNSFESDFAAWFCYLV